MLIKALATTPDDLDEFGPQTPHDGKKEPIVPQAVYHVVRATLRVQAYTHNKQMLKVYFIGFIAS